MLLQLLDFAANHWILSSIWAVLLLLLIKTESSRGGSAISPTQVTALINRENAKVVDIRSKDDFKTGHLPNSINIPAKDMTKRMTELNAYKDENIILICKTGTTAGATGALLTKEGFSKLHKLKGGIMEWQTSKLPLVKN